jgi:hypothetical protein
VEDAAAAPEGYASPWGKPLPRSCAPTPKRKPPSLRAPSSLGPATARAGGEGGVWLLASFCWPHLCRPRGSSRALMQTDHPVSCNANFTAQFDSDEEHNWGQAWVSVSVDGHEIGSTTSGVCPRAVETPIRQRCGVRGVWTLKASVKVGAARRCEQISKEDEMHCSSKPEQEIHSKGSACAWFHTLAALIL